MKARVTIEVEIECSDMERAHAAAAKLGGVINNAFNINEHGNVRVMLEESSIEPGRIELLHESKIRVSAIASYNPISLDTIVKKSILIHAKADDSSTTSCARRWRKMKWSLERADMLKKNPLVRVVRRYNDSTHDFLLLQVLELPKVEEKK